MTLRITFDLDETDLKFFRSQMSRAKKSVKEAPEEEVLATAETALAEVRPTRVPRFVAERLDRIEAMIGMLRDDEWALEGRERKDVVTALGYFADPEDLIPDSVPVLGYIDDAIMIELVVRELSHEIDAYRDFCRYRDAAPAGQATREEWLASKRRQLYARMRRRRQNRRRAGTTTRFKLL